MILRAKEFTWEFPRRPLLMGIVNVTPDSFSDGGRFLDPSAAIDHALRLEADGADILDIGGESTRPGAAEVSEAEELDRVLPVLRALARQTKAALSIDTLKPNVAAEAINAGASIVNDVGANRDDNTLWRIVAASGVGYVAMHMQGSPQTMQNLPRYDDVVREVNDFFENRLQRLIEAGVKSDCVVLDVGIGFGKQLEHNLQLLRQMRSFTRWQRPLLLGVSRKSFIKQLFGAEVDNRLPASLACECWGADQGVNIIRTHDVAATRQALEMTQFLQNRGA